MRAGKGSKKVAHWGSAGRHLHSSGGLCLMGTQRVRVRPFLIRMTWTGLAQRFLLCNNNEPWRGKYK